MKGGYNTIRLVQSGVGQARLDGWQKAVLNTESGETTTGRAKRKAEKSEQQTVWFFIT
jgi:hypothetical protein